MSIFFDRFFDSLSYLRTLLSTFCSRYHEWMKSPELQQLTASEPLTLEQEYDMQRSWREDSDSEGSSACNILTPRNVLMSCYCFCRWLYLYLEKSCFF